MIRRDRWWRPENKITKIDAVELAGPNAWMPLDPRKFTWKGTPLSEMDKAGLMEAVSFLIEEASETRKQRAWETREIASWHSSKPKGVLSWLFGC